jgi:uncharacterized protein involved in tolerance to divalent cations
LTGVLVVTTTTGSMEEAEAIAAVLLERRLAACVQIGPIESRYVWKGKIAQAEELMLTVKTRADRFEAVEAAIREMHSYEVPEILAVAAATGSGDYLKWVTETVVGSDG